MNKPTILAAMLAAGTTPAAAHEAQSTTEPAQTDSVMTVSPALQQATEDELFGRVWQNDQLSQRDRSLVTIAALVARGRLTGLGPYVERGLDSGVEPAEISEVLYHLAYYAGWHNAMEAEPVVATVFAARGISADAMPPADPAEMLPLNEQAEAARQENVQKTYGHISQGVVDDTTDLLFTDLWLRPALAPRDRSLVTVAALVAAGHYDQVTFHLGRAMDNGLTKDEASAMLHHLAFYAGWPNVFSTMPVAGKVFESRAE